MDLNRLENLVNNENINIVNWKMKNKGRIIDKYIFMDYSQIHTKTEEKCLLAEELGHYYHSAYYTLSSSKVDIDRAEYRANKWKCLVCVTKQALLDCYKKGLSNEFEIAEELEIEPDMVKFAYDYYFVK